MSENKKRRKQLILVICLLPFLAVTVWCGIHIYHDSNERASAKEDYSRANDIVHGLLSVNAWEEEMKKIASLQIENFTLSESQDSILRVQISQILNSMITKADSLVRSNDMTFKGKVRKWAVGIFIDWDKLREQVPEFTETIINEITKPESKERLKKIVQQKLNEYAAQTYDSSDSLMFSQLYAKYDAPNRGVFNASIEKKTAELQSRAYNKAYIILGIIILFLIPWFMTRKHPELQKPLFIMSVILAFLVLLVGLTTPMIEIDARIKKLDLTILGEHIIFHNQMLFYRSKSILQVVQILLETGQIDSVFVGFLILAFSVLLPVSKMISTLFYLLGEKIRRNALLQWMAFKSGKWSMADVMVVAIFMSYVGFNGILENQLKALEIKSESLSSITTNDTALQVGFILFLAFVLFGMFLAKTLERIAPPPGKS